MWRNTASPIVALRIAPYAVDIISVMSKPAPNIVYLISLSNASFG